MNPWIIIFICLAFLSITLIPVFLLVRSRRKKKDAAWREFASRHGLQYDRCGGRFSRPVVHGTLEEREFFLGEFRYAGGSMSGIGTRVSVGLLSPVPTSLSVAQGTASGLLEHGMQNDLLTDDKEFGRRTDITMNRISTNDREFDGFVSVMGENASIALPYLTQDRKKTILKALKRWKAIHIRNDRMVFENTLPLYDIGRVESAVNDLLHHVKALESVSA
jgi:hypothetical protein